jgi:hypothetical protein
MSLDKTFVSGVIAKANQELAGVAYQGKDITLMICQKYGGDEAKTVELAHALGLVRIVLERDRDCSFKDLCGDVFTPSANPSIPEAQLKREKEAYRRRFKKEGTWGTMLQARSLPTLAWDEHVDSLWGTVGLDFIGSGYASEFLSTAAAWLKENVKTGEIMQYAVDTEIELAQRATTLKSSASALTVALQDCR